MTDNAVPPTFSPLHQVHADAGAGFTDFAGWQMPVRYGSELEEHHAVRNAAGLFDLSHMAEIIVTGNESAAFLDYALCGKLSAIAIAQAKYSLLLSDDGGIIDDVIVYRTHENRYLVVANAGNRFQAAGALASRAANFDTTVIDESDSVALVAVQGPSSRAILEALPQLELTEDLAELKYYRSILGTYQGEEIMVARTGYTGEDGFELYVVADHAESLWKNLMVVGTDHGLVPAGLACRDTLRLEAGMPLYGHELSLDILPAQAGLARVVVLSKEDDFVGRAANEAGPPADARVLVGLTSEGRRAGRAGYPILAGEGGGDFEVGVVTSGALSPTLGHPIAMAYVDPQFAETDTQLFIDVRGKRIPASVTALPFYKRKASE
ncbi:MAG: glycine cleavage system aminomethyltransferase GcvT [Homoserinimonas sp.]